MGQSKLQKGRSLDAPLDIYLLNNDDSQESFGYLTFPFQRHLKGTGRLSQIQGRAGAIVALVMNPHEPDVLVEVRKIYSPDAQQEYIPAIQELGRKLLKKDWYARVDCDEVGLPNQEALMFYSSVEVADRLGLGEHLSSLEPKDLVKMAARPGQTIA